MNALPMLTFTREGETLKSQPLEKEISIGRGEGNVIRLEDRAVSRSHAIVRKTEEGVHIEKQSDFAPIRLNGIECTRALLKEGDVVEIGPYRMRLDVPKAAPAPAPVAPPTPVISETARNPDATVAIPDENVQTPEPMPTETVALGAPGESPSIGDFTGQISTAGLDTSPTVDLMAQPIAADALGAEAGSQDPGTSIFPTEGEGGGVALDIGLDSAGPMDEASLMPEEISAGPIDENAATKVLTSDVKARLEIDPGMANVTVPSARTRSSSAAGKNATSS